MLVLEILGGVAFILGIYAALLKFNAHCKANFGYVFFTKQVFGVWGFAAVLGLLGYWWYSATLQVGDKVYFGIPIGEGSLNGILLMVFAAIIGVLLLASNFLRTNLFFGLVGSLLQVLLFFLIAYVSFAFCIPIIFYLLGKYVLPSRYVVVLD